MKDTVSKIIERAGAHKTVRDRVAYIKGSFEIESVDNSQDTVVILYGPEHEFYISRTPLHEYIRELYYSCNRVDFITDDFSIAVARKE